MLILFSQVEIIKREKKTYSSIRFILHSIEKEKTIFSIHIKRIDLNLLGLSNIPFPTYWQNTYEKFGKTKPFSDSF